MIKCSPSKLELVSACPASAQRNLAFPFVENEHTKRGSHLHEITSLILQTGIDQMDELCSDLDEKDKKAVETCVEVAQMLLPKGKRISFIEERLPLEFLQPKLAGTPDLAYYDMTSKTIAVIDWKFGHGPVPDPSDNKQLMAYVLALTKTLKAQKYEVAQAYLVICQPCGTAKESYRNALFQADVFPTWEKEIKDAIEKAQEKDAIAIPGPHCKRSFCEAGKNGACPEFKSYSEAQGVEKSERSARIAAFAVGGLSPIVVERADLSFPIVVISEEAIQKAEDFRSKAEGLVLDQNSADGMGLLLNDITKFESQMVKNLKEVKKPLHALEDQIDEACAKGLTPLREAKEKAKKTLSTWLEEQTEERNKAIEKAKEVFGDGPTITAPVPIPEPVKVAGVTVKKVPEFEIPDKTKVPEMFLLINEALLKKAIESKGVTEKDTWLKIKWVDKAQSSGRR